jgi:hypothetical protein
VWHWHFALRSKTQQIRNSNGIIPGGTGYVVPRPPKPGFLRLNTHNAQRRHPLAVSHPPQTAVSAQCPARTAAPVAGAGQCTGCIWATAGAPLQLPLQEARRGPHGRRYVLHSCSSHAAGPRGLGGCSGGAGGAGRYPISWGACWAPPRSQVPSNVIKIAHATRLSRPFGLQHPPPGHPAAGWCGRVVPVLPLLLCTRPTRAWPSVGGQSPLGYVLRPYRPIQ